MHLFGYRLPGMSSLILWGLLWEIVGRADLTFFVPPLSEVLATLFAIIGTPAFKKALAGDRLCLLPWCVLCRCDRNYCWYLDG